MICNNMETYILHVSEEDGNILQYRYNIPAEPFETVIKDARFHQRQGQHVILFQEVHQTGCGWVMLKRVLSFT